MSFANFDFEAQKPFGSEPKPAPGSELDTIIRDTSLQIQKFGQLISQFGTSRKLVGTRRDTKTLRTTLDTLQTEISELDVSIEALIVKVNRAMNGATGKKGKIAVSDRQMMLKDRLNKEFHDLHNNFALEVRQYSDKKVAYPLKDPVDLQKQDESTPLLSGGNALQQQQQLLQEEQINETELQYQIALTEERNRQIERIHEGVVDVNAIMKDLGSLVGQQGEQVDTMENSILEVSGNVQNASRELTKADEYQRRKSKWCAIILVALCIFALIMVLAIVS